MKKQILVTQSAKETEKFGEKLANNLKDGGVVCLYGELGSGKTTFVRGFVKTLNPQSRVMSPTFILIREYAGPQKIYHLDLYRIEKLEKAKSLGLEEIFNNPRNIVIIEWPEIISSLLPKKRTEIHFKYLKENEREIRWTTT